MIWMTNNCVISAFINALAIISVSFEFNSGKLIKGFSKKSDGKSYTIQFIMEGGFHM